MTDFSKLHATVALLLDTPPVLADWLVENLPKEDGVEDVARLLRGDDNGGWHLVAVRGPFSSGGSYPHKTWADMVGTLKEWGARLITNTNWHEVRFEASYDEVGVLWFEPEMAGERPAPPLLNWLLTVAIGEE